MWYSGLGSARASRAGDGALATANFLLSQSIATRRRNEHARRVRSPEEIQESSSFPKYRLLL